jgi:predicted amino acid dehydrogenase
MTGLDEVLRRAGADLDAVGAKWAIIGGLAVATRAARPSQDLDFATSSNMPLPEVAAQVQEAFAALGYAVRIDEAGVPR